MAALVLWGHGQAGGPGVVARHAARLAATDRFAEVRACCLRGRPRLAEVLAAIAAPRIYLVPMLMADGYLARTALAGEIARAGPAAGRLRPTPVLGGNPRLAGLMLDLAGAAARRQGWTAAESTLLLIGHGAPREPASRRTLLEQAERIRRRRHFGRIATAFLEDRPAVVEALADGGAGPVVAVGFFVEAGPHGDGDVRRALAAAGRPFVHAGVVGQASELVALVLEQVALADRAAVAA